MSQHTVSEYSAVCFISVSFSYILVLFRLRHFDTLGKFYSYPSTMYEIFAHYFCNFFSILFSYSKAKIVNNTRNTYIWAKILSYIVVG